MFPMHKGHAKPRRTAWSRRAIAKVKSRVANWMLHNSHPAMWHVAPLMIRRGARLSAGFKIQRHEQYKRTRIAQARSGLEGAALWTRLSTGGSASGQRASPTKKKENPQRRYATALTTRSPHDGHAHCDAALKPQRAAKRAQSHFGPSARTAPAAVAGARGRHARTNGGSSAGCARGTSRTVYNSLGRFEETGEVRGTPASM